MSKNTTQDEPSFSILGQGIRDLSFENLITFEDSRTEQPEINIGIEADGRKVDDDVYEVTLRISAKANYEESPLFILELEYMGLCQIKNIPEDMIPSLLMIQTPAMLFPFARQIIADTTSNAGFPPLFLQPVDFATLYHNSQKNSGEIVGHA
ncbi:MAG: protein-export chaperone SecB [Proteobacteria bacterium]|nr:protein-export chaperone SecB [Pseudomonadota bacterium]